MLLYQHRCIIELTKPSTTDQGMQIWAYLEDGSNVCIPVEWIDETRKGELDAELERFSFPFPQDRGPVDNPTSRPFPLFGS